MPKTATIQLGGQELKIHAFNIGELERVTALFDAAGPASNVKMAFGVLRIALERAEPKVEDIDGIEIESMDEVVEASNVILTLAGINKKPNGSAGDPQTGPAAGS